MQLTQSFQLPNTLTQHLANKYTLTERYTAELLENKYWTEQHFQEYIRYTEDTTAPNWKYFQENNHGFEQIDAYLYNRYKRCLMGRLAEIFTAHKDEYKAFQTITNTVKERKIKSIGFQRLRKETFDNQTEYIPWGVVQNVSQQINNYYDEHGNFPTSYLELVSLPNPNGTLSYASDEGQILDLSYKQVENVLEVELKTPGSTNPDELDTYHDWNTHNFTVDCHSYFTELLEQGEIKRPEIRRETRKTGENVFVLDVPVKLNGKDSDISIETESDCVLAVDLGVKTQATATVVEKVDCCTGELSQVSTPFFIDLAEKKEKLFRLKNQSENVNDEIKHLRETGKDHTERFDKLLSEYRRKRGKERELREQIQHHVANTLVWLAAQHNCETVVFESLEDLEAGKGMGGGTSWQISSWARGSLLQKVEYKADVVDIDVETVNPWRTSRYCPRCGEYGNTVKSPSNPVEIRSGGHFQCSNCRFEGDRDYVASLNVARVFLDASEWRISEVKSVTYTATDETPVFRRSTGVRSPGMVWTGGAWPLSVKPRDPNLLERKIESGSGDAPPVSPESSIRLVLNTTKCH
jgi:putative transposase